MATIKINGKDITVEDGTLILDAAREAGYEIPTFCYQADLVGVGSCRMCLVEIEGQKKLQPSCVTPVLDGMSINTESPTIMSARASMLEFLLANHAMDCPVCDKGGECELQDMVYKYGPHKGRHTEKKFKFHEKDYKLSPVIIKNSNRCVQCMKCVRVCAEVVGRGVLGGTNRGDHQEETSFLRTYLDCDHCGNCIEVCPVGCFMRLPYRYKTRPWDLKSADSVCPYCATGCRIVIEERDGLVIRSKAQLGVGLNSETLCARGRFGFDYINSDERITAPMVRKHGELVEVSWDEALSTIRANLDTYRGERLGGVASPRLTNEELYVFQKLFREVLGSPNVDSSSRWDPGAVEAFISATEMADGGVSVFDAMESDTLIVAGTQLSDENPITDYIVRRISAGRMMNVVIASPRAMKLDSSATHILRHRPAAEGELLESIALGLYEGNADKLTSHEVADSLKGSSSASLAESAGIDAADAKAVTAALSASSSVSIIAGDRFLRHPESSAGLALTVDLLRSLGKKVKVVPVLDRCNQRGAWEMGVHPALGPGYSKAPKAGLGTAAMLKAAVDGSLDAMIVAGADLVSMHNDEALAREALSKLKFLVVADTFMTETASASHVVLPAATFAEKEGTLTNQEGRVQSIKRLLKPQFKSKTDGAIIGSIARLFDSSFTSRPSEVFKEVRRRAPMYANVSLEFVNMRNTDNQLDNKPSLVASAGRTVEATKTFGKPSVASDTEYPFTLLTGNHLFHIGRYSRKSPTLVGLLSAAVVEVSEKDAASLGVKSGDRVKVASRNYSATVTLRTVKNTRQGVAFIAENYEDVPVNRFYTPGEKLTRIRISKS